MPFEVRVRDSAPNPFASEGFLVRPLDVDADGAVLQPWFTMSYAGFWGMRDKTLQDVRSHYRALMDSGCAMAYVGCRGGCPAFLLECYDPARDELGRHYRVRPGDVGMHFIVGPPSTPEHGFTRRVFRVLMRFIFRRLQARRVVVEPDLRNEKVHVLNREMGFAYAGAVQLPEKLAALAFCTRESFVLSQRKAFSR